MKYKTMLMIMPILAVIGVFGFQQFLLNMLLKNYVRAVATLVPSLAALFYFGYLGIWGHQVWSRERGDEWVTNGRRMDEVERYIISAKRKVEKSKKRRG